MINRKTRKLLWGALIALAVIMFPSFIYNDLLVTSRHGINFWNILFNGRFFYFYQDNVVRSGNLYQGLYESDCIYNILVYIVFAIWNFPMWLLEKASVDVMNTLPCLLWMKLLPVAATVLSARYIGKILKTVGISDERNSLAKYLYFSSAVILANVLNTSRYDSLSSVFMLLSVYAFLKRNDRSFLIFSGFAICFNLFSLLVFAPLLLLRKKSILLVIRDFILVFIPYLITSVPFILQASNASGTHMSSYLFSLIFKETNGLFSWFVIAYAGILVYAYLHKEEEKEQRRIFWLCFVSITSVFAFGQTYPYWVIMIAPFAALLIGTAKPEYDVIGLLLEMIGMAGFVLKNMLIYDWCYLSTMKSMLPSLIWPERVYRVSQFSEKWIALRDLYFPVVFQSVFVAGMVILALIYFPDRKRNESMAVRLSEHNSLSSVLILRFLMTAVICMIPFITLFW